MLDKSGCSTVKNELVFFFFFLIKKQINIKWWMSNKNVSIKNYIYILGMLLCLIISYVTSSVFIKLYI